MTHRLRLAATVLLIFAACIMLTSSVSAEWRVDIESKTVPAGATGVTIGVTAYWDLPLGAFALPVIVREIDPGSFWSGFLPYDTGGCADYHPFAHGVTWNWAAPWAIMVEAVRPAPPKERLLWCDPPADTLYNGVSPDQFVALSMGISTSAAPRPAGWEILRLTFDVTSVPGSFEFDTACYIFPQSTINMVDIFAVDHGPLGTDEVTFNKGVITIAPPECQCPRHGDCNDDGSIDPLDVIWLIDYALRGHDLPQPSDLYCPAVHRGDWDCNDRLNLVDIVKIIEYVFRASGTGPCDPCAAD